MSATIPTRSRNTLDPLSDSESDDSHDNGEGWNDVEDDDDEEQSQEVISLLEDRVFPDVLSMLAHCKDAHKFDFLAIRQRLQLDFHGCVKLVNFSKSTASTFIHYAATTGQERGMSIYDSFSYCSYLPGI
jgi:hypothetical protein